MVRPRLRENPKDARRRGNLRAHQAFLCKGRAPKSGGWNLKSENSVAFDNKLNFIHKGGMGIEPEIARGLWIYLNSSQVDHYFRVFSGHTQVNATGLRQMRFPTERQLSALGRLNIDGQESIDAAVESVIAIQEDLV